MKRILLWLRTIRPQTLFASACPVVVGWVAAKQLPMTLTSRGTIVGVVTLLCAIALQVLANLVNDYYDYLHGSDKKGRVGFRRGLAEGEISISQMRLACLITACISVVLGGYLVMVGGWRILIIGLTALLFAWLYSATSHSLSYLGIADVFVFVYYGIVASVGTTYLLYCSQFALPSWGEVWSGGHEWLQGAIGALRTSLYAGGVCGLISMCVLAINNIRDIDDDREAGKRTFPVRFGKRTALVVFGLIVVLTPVLAYMAFGWSWQMMVVVPGVYVYYKVLRASGKEYNKCLLLTGIWNMIYTILVLVG